MCLLFPLLGFSQKKPKKSDLLEQRIAQLEDSLQQLRGQYQLEKLETMHDSACYAIGYNVAQNLKAQGVGSINLAAMLRAFEDFSQDGATMFPQQDANNLLNSYFRKINEEKNAKVIEANKAFLAENALRPGVISLPSGLQYEVLETGDGPNPTLSSKVTTHYHGTTIDGAVFDSSVERGQPVSFPVSGVIKGWTEALQLMRTGDKWKLYIPHELAYGEKGAGPKIGPYATLVFEVELIEIN